MRFLYTLLTYLALPGAFIHLLWRARRQPDYLRHWGERLGFVARQTGPVIWLHAVSVGETRAAAPLVEAVLESYPGQRILLTHTTPTGRAAGRALFGVRVAQAYLPYDLPGAARRFMRRVKPRLGLFMETEIWPNLYRAAQCQGVPLALVNARMSARSARGYGRLAALTRQCLRQLRVVAAQTGADAERLRHLGAGPVTVCGNLKFDVSLPDDLAHRAAVMREHLGARPIWLAASTREGEEALILDAWVRLRGVADMAGALLVIVPRHPQRFAAVAALIEAHGLRYARRSAGGQIAPDTEVFLGDSMGELAVYYAAVDLAFVGGSLLPLGGQNLIEAAAAGCPILIGPHTFNFQAVAEAAIACGAAERVNDPEQLVQRVHALLQDSERRQAMRAAGRAFSAAHRGATLRVMELLAPFLVINSAGRPPR